MTLAKEFDSTDPFPIAGTQAGLSDPEGGAGSVQVLFPGHWLLTYWDYREWVDQSDHSLGTIEPLTYSGFVRRIPSAVYRIAIEHLRGTPGYNSTSNVIYPHIQAFGSAAADPVAVANLYFTGTNFISGDDATLSSGSVLHILPGFVYFMLPTFISGNGNARTFGGFLYFTEMTNPRTGT